MPLELITLAAGTLVGFLVGTIAGAKMLERLQADVRKPQSFPKPGSTKK